MACYRNGGCGPYENRSCYECPASKPDYVKRTKIPSTGKPFVNGLPPLDTEKIRGLRAKIDLYFEPWEIEYMKEAVKAFESEATDESDIIVAVDAPL